MTELINTIKDRCQECYACVRNCPVKAVRVKEGQAGVIGDRCIHCGHCVRVCSQQAKGVRDYRQEVEAILRSKRRVVAGLAPSFPSFHSGITLGDWISYLYQLGFAGVYEVSWGAQLIVDEYKKLLTESGDLLISTACPVIVNLIRKYYPALIPNLAPVASPMLALSRYIQEIEGAETVSVMIGPCLAKKGEFDGVDNSYVLTFSEILNLGVEFDQERVGQMNYSDQFSYNPGQEPLDSARRLPLAGGLLKAVTAKTDCFPEGYIKVEGKEKVLDLLNSIERKEIRPRFIDILFCEGCINGVDLSRENYFKKEAAINRFIDLKEFGTCNQVLYSEKAAGGIDLSVEVKGDFKELSRPSEERIWEILNRTSKFREEDLLNCGACGYQTCREKAIAVYQGLAEVEMCLPYLLSEKRSEVKRVQELNRELDTLINSSYDGLAMVDRDGVIQRVNEAFSKLPGLPRDELLGKKDVELERERLLYPSVTMLCLHEKREITIIQNTVSGQRVLTTGSPFYDEEGQIQRVVINTRNLAELNKFEDREGEKLKKYLESRQDIDSQEGPGHIICKSEAMKDILRLCQKIAGTDSSVLLLGESGVGKEVVARYLHEQGNRGRNLVKINCAAIPESLLESELFGYETGAFSGARRDGKPGLIERADGGTLFLDEIGEMPYNMQAKLLQILQEHRVTRIAGTEPISVNFRLITATNRDLRELVKNKEFREDLYFRINVVPIYLPPLRERRGDILPLVNYFLEEYNNRYDKRIQLDKDSCSLLLKYNWPGNVREISNLLERVIITTEDKVVSPEYLQEFLEFKDKKEKKEIIVREILPLQEAVAQVEKKLLLLAREEGSTTYRMAEMLGVNQSTIVRKLSKYFN